VLRLIEGNRISLQESVLADGSHKPTHSARRDSLSRMEPHLLEGTGFVAALKRGILAALFQIRWRRGTFFVHVSCMRQ
jgi:hypothetical protein